MWPYEFFHQYSAIDINEGMGVQKKIFLSIYFDEKDSLQDKRINEIKSIIDNYRDAQGNLYHLKVEQDRGVFNTNILKDIADSTIVICDITLMGKCEVRRRSEAIFNANVMYELGLAVAWKMEEQVILIWDEAAGGGFNPNDLPSDFKTMFVEKVSSKYGIETVQGSKNITDIIAKRLNAFEQRKNLIIKNLKGMLDENSMLMLRNHHHGLMISLRRETVEDILMLPQSLRHLLNTGMLRLETFPSDPPTWGYSWTEIGREVMRQMKQLVYPDILIDADLITQWHNEHEWLECHDKEGYFKEKYGLIWGDTIQDFVTFIPDAQQKEILVKLESDRVNLKKIRVKDSKVLYGFLRFFGHNDGQVRNMIKEVCKNRPATGKFLKSWVEKHGGA